MLESILKCELLPSQVTAVEDNESAELLEALGVGVNDKIDLDAVAMDAAPNMVTANNAGTPVQFLQFWDPVPVRIVTAPRVADDVMGRRIAGSWEDEEVVVKVLERVGQAKVYGDTQNVPFAQMNTTFEHRTIVRFESGFEITHLEERRAARMQVSAEAEKRAASAESLAIMSNNVAFNGWNAGNNRTYGFLNDPKLPAYQTVATPFESATFIQLVAIFQNAIQTLITNTKGLFNGERDTVTITLPPTKKVYLTTPTQYYGGISVEDWLKKNYPNVRIIYAPQLTRANGGADVMYIHIDMLDGQTVLAQNIQSSLYFLGFERKAKGVVEDYSCATAGFMLKQPLGIARFTGI